MARLHDQNFAKTLQGLAKAQTYLADLKAILDGESEYFGDAYKRTLVEGQEHANRLFDLLNLGQRQVRAREEALRAEARRQGILPGFDEPQPPIDGEDEAMAAFEERFDAAERQGGAGANGGGSPDEGGRREPGPYEAAHFQVLQHGESNERYVVALGRPEGGDGEEVVIGYVELPAGADLPEEESLPSLHYRTDPRALDYLNNHLEPWGAVADWGDPAPPPEQPKKETKRGRRKKGSPDVEADPASAN